MLGDCYSLDRWIRLRHRLDLGFLMLLHVDSITTRNELNFSLPDSKPEKLSETDSIFSAKQHIGVVIRCCFEQQQASCAFKFSETICIDAGDWLAIRTQFWGFHPDLDDLKTTSPIRSIEIDPPPPHLSIKGSTRPHDLIEVLTVILGLGLAERSEEIACVNPIDLRGLLEKSELACLLARIPIQGLGFVENQRSLLACAHSDLGFWIC
jgi:hypothetical protein